MSTFNSGMGTPNFYSPYQPGGDWNAMINGIVQQAIADAMRSQQNSAAANQRSERGGPLQQLFSGAPVRRGLNNFFASMGLMNPNSPNHPSRLRGINPQPMPQPPPPRLQPNRGVNRTNKWDPSSVQWGDPAAGLYQPPNWAGWNAPGARNVPGIANNPYNPMGANFGGPSTAAMRPPDDLFKQTVR